MKYIFLSFLVLYILQVQVLHIHAMNLIISLHMFKPVKYFGDLSLQESIFKQFLTTAVISQNRYCQEAVDSVTVVNSCPTSKTEWDVAARKKNCGRIASKQNCTTVEKFQYHCVVNGLRNKLLEVCAPTRIIFGRVFNIMILKI